MSRTAPLAPKRFVSPAGWLVAAAAALLAAAGCGAPRRAGPDLPPGVELEGLDDQALLDRAVAAADEGRLGAALADYDLLLDAFPDSPLRPLALYNGSLALEALGRCDEALPRLAAFLETGPQSDDARDARFHVGSCLETLRRWPEAARAFEALLEEALPPADRLEAGARAGWALVKAGALDRAEPVLAAALLTWRKDERLRAVPRDSWAALVTFAQGEIHRRRAAQVRLRGSRDELERDLDEKAERFARAEERYLEALRLQHRTWSVAAGYRLGRMYERLHAELVAVELPPELTTEMERAAYREHLHRRIVPLLEKARIAYDETVFLGERLGVAAGQWTRRAVAGHTRVEALLKAERTPAVP